ncbi:hypothetical protein HOB94_03225 [bacterium]|nr:hypothetical protein [bacterium]
MKNDINHIIDSKNHIFTSFFNINIAIIGIATTFSAWVTHVKKIYVCHQIYFLKLKKFLISLLLIFVGI